jgi:hypothetical protein
VEGALGRVVVEVQIIFDKYLVVKKRMHAVYRINRGDFGSLAGLVSEKDRKVAMQFEELHARVAALEMALADQHAARA